MLILKYSIKKFFSFDKIKSLNSIIPKKKVLQINKYYAKRWVDQTVHQVLKDVLDLDRGYLKLLNECINEC